MSETRIGSLCSGVGGLDLAVESVIPGSRLAWYAQYEPPDKKGKPDRHQYAAQIMAHRFPGVPNLGDITAIDYAGVEPVEILTAGFPCTDVSLAGKRAGLREGTRSGVWSHVARAIGELRPRLVLIENVRSLTSAWADSDMEPCPWCLGESGDEHSLRAAGAVCGDLADLGFDAEWLTLPASGVGAPHKRERVFILAWPAAEAQDDRWTPRLPGRHGTPQPGTEGFGAAPEDADIAAGGERRLAASGQAPGRPPRADAGGRGGASAADAEGDGRNARRTEPARIVRGSDAAERSGATAGQSRALGVGSNPEGAGLETRRQGRPGGSPAADPDGRGLPGRPEPDREPEEPQADDHDDQHDPDGPVLAWGDYAPAIQRWERVLGRPAPRPVDDRGRLAPRFVEFMMGLPVGWVTDAPGIPRNPQLHALGNGVVPQHAAAALSELLARAAGGAR